MAGEARMFKFLTPRLRPQSTDIQAAVGWGAATATAAIWLVQPFDWIRKNFLEKGQSEEK